MPPARHVTPGNTNLLKPARACGQCLQQHSLEGIHAPATSQGRLQADPGVRLQGPCHCRAAPSPDLGHRSLLHVRALPCLHCHTERQQGCPLLGRGVAGLLKSENLDCCFGRAGKPCGRGCSCGLSSGPWVAALARACRSGIRVSFPGLVLLETTPGCVAISGERETDRPFGPALPGCVHPCSHARLRNWLLRAAVALRLCSPHSQYGRALTCMLHSSYDVVPITTPRPPVPTPPPAGRHRRFRRQAPSAGPAHTLLMMAPAQQARTIDDDSDSGLNVVCACVRERVSQPASAPTLSRDPAAIDPCVAPTATACALAWDRGSRRPQTLLLRADSNLCLVDLWVVVGTARKTVGMCLCAWAAARVS
jgi:hypothetical protein